MLTELLDDLRRKRGPGHDGRRAGPGSSWATRTLAAGWSIAHQIARLGWTDGKSLLAVTDPDEFVRQRRESEHIGVDAGAAEGARAEPGELLAHWRAGRDRLLVALTATRSTVAWSGTGRR